MSKPSELTKQIFKEEERISNLIIELRIQNSVDQSVLDGHEVVFRTAVFEGADPTVISGINTKRQEAARQIQHRNELISALSTQSNQENPSIQKLLINEFTKRLQGIEDLEKKAAAMQRKLMSHHKAILDGIREMEGLRKQLHINRTVVNEHHHRLSDESRDELSIPDTGLPVVRYTEGDPIYQMMSQLLIERKSLLRGEAVLQGNED